VQRNLSTTKRIEYILIIDLLKTNMMKKILIAALLLSSFCGLNAQSNWEKDPYLVKNLASETISQVHIETSGGSIYALDATASAARLEMYVGSNNGRPIDLSKDEIKARLDEYYDISITVTDHKLSAVVKAKERITNWKRALNISFKVFVPGQASTDLHTSGGSIDIRGFTGTEEVYTSGGSLHIEKVTGKITGRTSGGSIDLINVKDNIDATTSGGSIHAEECAGNIKLGTSGGSLTLRNLQGSIVATTSGGSVDGHDIAGDLAAHTSGGSISLRDLSCSLKSSTSGGHIDVEMKQLGKYIDLSNSGGSITLQLPKNKGVDLNLRGDHIRVNEMENFSGSQKEHEVTGTMNGGGVPVTIHAGGGNINLDLN
jgi:Putative adhesin